MLSEAQVNFNTPGAPQRSTVDGEWTFRQAQTGDWKKTSVPVSVHTALLQNGMIEDPYYRDNESKLQWIEQADWEFQCTFQVSEALLLRKHIELRWYGLDTYAHVYLNDSLVMETNNMFRTFTKDVKKWLKPGANTLHVYFESPVKKVETEWKNLGYELPGGIRTMTRKAQFHYGWDWGPRLVGCGILKKPELVGWDDLIIDNIYVTTKSYTPERAVMIANFRYRCDFKEKVTISVRSEGRKSIEDHNFQIGEHTDSTTWDIDNPKLWWPLGMGEQPLYDFNIDVKRGTRVIEKVDIRAAIRTVQLVTQKDDKGEPFYFKVNDVPVFAKGANYIPQDMFQDRVRPEQYKRLLDDVVASNMNMLRVWGGGIYEDDLFYQLCDSRGIMVWQDFMYACAMYPGSGDFFKNASKEAYEQIERLRQHPSIVLWCGNNENSEAWHHWGWQMQFNEQQRKKLWRDYEILFKDVLPTYVENYAGGVPYWESSPKFGRGNPKSNSEGDSHYWGVWHDEEPFEIFNKKVPRFMSEYGFQSFPEWRTIGSFTVPEDRELESKVMLAHQKHPRGNALIAEYMKRDYRSPKKFEDFVYVSQILQAEGMRTGIEAHRRNKPYCMGTLYWQLNDVWPVASWAGRDYFGRWKALQYYVREAFSPVAALPIVEGELLSVYGVSDKTSAQKVNLSVRVLEFEGAEVSHEILRDVQLKPDSSKRVWQGALKTLLNGRKAENVVVEITLSDEADKQLYRRLMYLTPVRKLTLPNVNIKMQVQAVNDGFNLVLESDKLAKNVLLQTEAEGFFSDNYFDMLPGERRTILFKTKRIIDAPEKAFSVMSLEDTY